MQRTPREASLFNSARQRGAVRSNNFTPHGAIRFYIFPLISQEHTRDKQSAVNPHHRPAFAGCKIKPVETSGTDEDLPGSPRFPRQFYVCPPPSATSIATAIQQQNLSALRCWVNLFLTPPLRPYIHSMAPTLPSPSSAAFSFLRHEYHDPNSPNYNPAPSRNAVWVVLAVFGSFALCFLAVAGWIRCVEIVERARSPLLRSSSARYDARKQPRIGLGGFQG